MDDRARVTDEIVDAYEKKYGDTIRNPAAWRNALLRKLATHSDAEITTLHANLCGNAGSAAMGKPEPKNYGLRALDRAVTDAAMLAARSGWTPGDIETVLTQEHGAELAGRAYALALDDAYVIVMPRYAPKAAEQDARINLGDYLAR